MLRLGRQAVWHGGSVTFEIPTFGLMIKGLLGFNCNERSEDCIAVFRGVYAVARKNVVAPPPALNPAASGAVSIKYTS